MAIPSAPHDEARWYSTRTLAIQPAPASASVGVVTPRGEGAREKSATMVDEDRVSLSVSFAPEWTARFNRPVLALNSYYFKCVRPSATFPDGAAAAGAGVADAIVADAGAGAESLAHRQRRRAPAPGAFVRRCLCLALSCMIVRSDHFMPPRYKRCWKQGHLSKPARK